MKYIRTKDELGIYVEHDGEYKDLNEGTYFKTWRGFSIHEDWKVADTIKELCDEFVLTWADQKRLHSSLEEALFWKQQLTERTKYFGTIYGAIWTDKGLIYVAKMNDKGELELL